VKSRPRIQSSWPFREAILVKFRVSRGDAKRWTCGEEPPIASNVPSFVECSESVSG